MNAEVSPDGRLIAFDLLCGRLNDAATLNEVATGLRKRQALLAGEPCGGGKRQRTAVGSGHGWRLTIGEGALKSRHDAPS
jgi:hypothetical protein